MAMPEIKVSHEEATSAFTITRVYLPVIPNRERTRCKTRHVRRFLTIVLLVPYLLAHRALYCHGLLLASNQVMGRVDAEAELGRGELCPRAKVVTACHDRVVEGGQELGRQVAIILPNHC